MKTITALASTAALLLALTGCTTTTTTTNDVPSGDTTSTSAAPTTKAAPKAAPKDTVQYIVKGPKGATVSYAKAKGFEQTKLKKTTFDKTFNRSNDFIAFSLTVSGTSKGGVVSCEIKVDGKSTSKNSSDGQYATASCSDSAF